MGAGRTGFPGLIKSEFYELRDEKSLAASSKAANATSQPRNGSTAVGEYLVGQRSPQGAPQSAVTAGQQRYIISFRKTVQSTADFTKNT
jgi:hypothetical protein